jgi:hypothetical protein
MQGTLGILPPVLARLAFAPSFTNLALPPVRLGSAMRFAVTAGQARAPPILI